MEPIRLWRSWDATCALQPFDVKKSREYDDEYAALTRADFDAREAEYRDAEVLMARMREVVAAATARADALAALLKEARGRVQTHDSQGYPSRMAANFLARIDAATGEKK